MRPERLHAVDVLRAAHGDDLYARGGGELDGGCADGAGAAPDEDGLRGGRGRRGERGVGEAERLLVVEGVCGGGEGEGEDGGVLVGEGGGDLLHEEAGAEGVELEGTVLGVLRQEVVVVAVEG